MSFLNDLYGNDAPGFLAVWHKRSGPTNWFRANQLETATSYLQHTAATEDVYFGWGLQAKQLSQGRGKSADVIALPGIMMDIDLKSDVGVHAQDALPTDLEEVVGLLRQNDFPLPTAIRHSGNGLYFDWLFRSLELLEEATHHRRLAMLSKSVQTAVIRLAAEHRNWKLDNTSDLARVTRMPGTQNHKTAPPKPVSLIELHHDKRYSVEELEQAIAKFQTTTSPPKKRAVSRPSNAEKTESPTRPPTWDAIVAGCRWAQWVEANAARLPEPDWYAAASVLGRCQHGDQRFHELSARDDRYDESQTAEKLQRAILEAGPRTCENIHTELSHDECRNCPFYARSKSPIVLGYSDPDLVQLMSQYVLDVNTRRYVDLNSGVSIDDRSFNDLYRHVIGEAKSPHLAMTASSLTLKVRHVDYLAGVDDRFVWNGASGEIALNSWVRSGAIATEGECATILKHFDYLIPDISQRDHLLNCLAHVIQRPAAKIGHVQLIIGKQGTGKSFIGRLLASILGERNVRTVQSRDVVDDWTANLGNCQALIVEELSAFDKMDAYNKLKTLISEDTILANEKFVKKHQIRTPRMIVAFSNHRSPISLEESDRRFWIFDSDVDKRPPEYYDVLFGHALGEEVGAFVHLLRKRDLTAFSPTKPPPMTEAKKMLVQRSRPVFVQEIEALIEGEMFPFHRDVGSLEEVRRALESAGQRAPSIRELSEAFKVMGMANRGQVRWRNGKVRLWVWRNQEKWQFEDIDSVRAEALMDFGSQAASLSDRRLVSH